MQYGVRSRRSHGLKTRATAARAATQYRSKRDHNDGCGGGLGNAGHDVEGAGGVHADEIEPEGRVARGAVEHDGVDGDVAVGGGDDAVAAGGEGEGGPIGGGGTVPTAITSILGAFSRWKCARLRAGAPAVAPGL